MLPFDSKSYRDYNDPSAIVCLDLRTKEYNLENKKYSLMDIVGKVGRLLLSEKFHKY